jgi:Trypsin-like peptidase domain
MFENSIEKVSAFTRPINSILRTYGGSQIIPGSSTLFFVNNEGYAVTCKHVIDILASAEKINQTYAEFKIERDKISKDGKFKMRLKGLEMKYKYTPGTVVQILIRFVDCVDSMSGFTWHVHPKYDLAILKFNDFKKIHYTGFADFLKDSSKIRQGKYLCRLGFPFPEFTNYKYNEATDSMEWTSSGNQSSPRFPIEGMVTRFLAEDNKVFGIELSTPGLKGQSGGPLFSENGSIYGMQFSTKHLHLGFDLVNKEILVDNRTIKISDYSFLHLGQCVHVDIIKEFLSEKKVRYHEID